MANPTAHTLHRYKKYPLLPYSSQVISPAVSYTSHHKSGSCRNPQLIHNPYRSVRAEYPFLGEYTVAEHLSAAREGKPSQQLFADNNPLPFAPLILVEYIWMYLMPGRSRTYEVLDMGLIAINHWWKAAIQQDRAIHWSTLLCRRIDHCQKVHLSEPWAYFFLKVIMANH